MPNMGAQIARHNSRVLKSRGRQNPPSCNCQKSRVGECPIPGACNTNGVVYQATVRSSGGEEEHYVGLAQNFKTRFRTHRANLAQKKPEGSITLYNYFWKEKEGGKDPKVEWKILEKNLQTFNPVTEICRLCTREKFNIVMNPEKATLNSRQEIFAYCRHKRSRLIGRPPG